MEKNDRFSNLEEIINLFCNASTACFNMEKTEALPIGTPKHRNRVITRRILGENTNKLPEHIRLIKDGEPMRTLGLWIGNNIVIEDKWNKITEIQKKVIDVWKVSHPTLRGKELILKALTKIMKDFIWDGNKRGLMRLDYTAKIREKGGLGMPDLRTRMKAIDIMWLKNI